MALKQKTNLSQQEKGLLIKLFNRGKLHKTKWKVQRKDLSKAGLTEINIYKKRISKYMDKNCKGILKFESKTDKPTSHKPVWVLDLKSLKKLAEFCKKEGIYDKGLKNSKLLKEYLFSFEKSIQEELAHYLFKPVKEGDESARTNKLKEIKKSIGTTKTGIISLLEKCLPKSSLKSLEEFNKYSLLLIDHYTSKMSQKQLKSLFGQSLEIQEFYNGKKIPNHLLFLNKHRGFYLSLIETYGQVNSDFVQKQNEEDELIFFLWMNQYQYWELTEYLSIRFLEQFIEDLVMERKDKFLNLYSHYNNSEYRSGDSGFLYFLPYTYALNEIANHKPGSKKFKLLEGIINFTTLRFDSNMIILDKEKLKEYVRECNDPTSLSVQRIIFKSEFDLWKTHKLGKNTIRRQKNTEK